MTGIRRPLIAVALGGLLAVSACAATGPRETVLAASDIAIGEPERCLQIRSIRDSDVRSDKVIDFVMLGGDVFRNELPNRCPGLGFERAFTYTTSLSQLCSTEIIRVLNTGAGARVEAACGLGQFIPIDPARANEMTTVKDGAE